MIQKYAEFIGLKNVNESISSDLWSKANGNSIKYKKLISKYIFGNLNVVEFLKFFRTSLEQALPKAVQDENKDAEYNEPDYDEDNNYEPGGLAIKDSLSEFSMDMTDGEFGDFGFSFDVSGDEYTIYVFEGELDVSDTELAETMIHTYDILLETTIDAMRKEEDANYKNDEIKLDAEYDELATTDDWFDI